MDDIGVFFCIGLYILCVSGYCNDERGKDGASE